MMGMMVSAGRRTPTVPSRATGVSARKTTSPPGEGKAVYLDIRHPSARRARRVWVSAATRPVRWSVGHTQPGAMAQNTGEQGFVIASRATSALRCCCF